MNNFDFDEDRARAGEPIQFCGATGEWNDVSYVGMCPLGPVVHRPDLCLLITYELRMKPPSRWTLIFESHDDASRTLHKLTGSSERYNNVKIMDLPPDA